MGGQGHFGSKGNGVFLKILTEGALANLANADIITLQGSALRNSWGRWPFKVEAVGGRLPALGVSVPVVNLVEMIELFWGPFSAKILSVYSVAGSRSVRAYSTMFPDTVRVISGTKHEIHTLRRSPLLVGAFRGLGTKHAHLLLMQKLSVTLQKSRFDF